MDFTEYKLMDFKLILWDNLDTQDNYLMVSC